MNDVIPQGNGGFAVPTVQTQGVMSSATQMRALAETFAAIQSAKSFPRDVKDAVDNIKNECQNKSLAEMATYTYAKGGSDVSGPSIHLAKVLARHWGNFEAGVRELETKNGSTTCEAFAWDKQTNYRESKTFDVKHVIHTKKGDKLLTDDREVWEKVSNYGSRRERACILSVIPKWVCDLAVEECKKTLSADIGTGAARTKKIAGLMEAFKKFGVTTAMVEARIQRRIEAMTDAQYVNLKGIGLSLKDGMSSVESWFDMEADEKARQQNADGAVDAEATVVNGEGAGAAADSSSPKSQLEALNQSLGLKRGSDLKPPAQKPQNAAAEAGAAAQSDGAGEAEQKDPNKLL